MDELSKSSNLSITPLAKAPFYSVFYRMNVVKNKVSSDSTATMAFHTEIKHGFSAKSARMSGGACK